MSDHTFDTLERNAHASRASPEDLPENVVRAYVEYSRGNVIANEEQFALAALAKVTGYLRRFETNVNDVKIGPSSGGKSHLQHALSDLFPTSQQYSVSDGSKMSIVDDEDWDHTIFAWLDEWNKIPDKLTEIIKSTAGEDLKYTYGRSESKGDGTDERETTKHHTYAKPFDFLYAQFSMDNELWNRLLKLYVDDDERIHRAIGKKEAGHDHIQIEGFDHEYIYDTKQLESNLYAHHNNLSTGYVELSDKERLLGQEHAIMPPAVWYIAEPIFDHSRTEVNRIYGMVFNLMRASAVLNKQRRETVEVERELQGDTVGAKTVEAHVVAPQDVANVLSAYETLLGTTHELERRKRVIVEAIRHNSGVGEANGCTIDKIHEYLDRDATHSTTPKKEQLRDILEELEDNYIINIDERGAPNSAAHLYQFKTMAHIAAPRVSNISSLMTDEQVAEMDDYWNDVDLDDPFEGVTDPFRDQPFKQTVSEFESRFGSNVGDRAEKAPDATDPDDSTDQFTINDAMGDGDATVLENPLKSRVYELIADHADEKTFPIDAQEHHTTGIVPVGKTLAETDVSGTVFDPDAPIWNEWAEYTGRNRDEVSSEGDARAHIDDVIDELNGELVQYDPEGDDEVRVTVRDALP